VYAFKFGLFTYGRSGLIGPGQVDSIGNGLTKELKFKVKSEDSNGAPISQTRGQISGKHHDMPISKGMQHELMTVNAIVPRNNIICLKGIHLSSPSDAVHGLIERKLPNVCEECVFCAKGYSRILKPKGKHLRAVNKIKPPMTFSQPRCQSKCCLAVLKREDATPNLPTASFQQTHDHCLDVVYGMYHHIWQKVQC
jgi:hypothetical protein